MPSIYETVDRLKRTYFKLPLGVLMIASTYFVFIKLLFGIAAWAVLAFGSMGITELVIYVVLHYSC
ncbi:MAG: hypothetical protein ACI35P_14095 [Bacillus sp. (in: firmicutes)]